MAMLRPLPMEFEFPIFLFIKTVTQAHEKKKWKNFPQDFRTQPNSTRLVPQTNQGEKVNLRRPLQITLIFKRHMSWFLGALCPGF